MAGRKNNDTRKAPFPTREQILEFLKTFSGKAGKREIAKAFHIRGDDRIRLKKLLNEMKADGLLDAGHKGIVHSSGGLPNVTVIDITGIDSHGEPTGHPSSWKGQGPPPEILVPVRSRAPVLGLGDRALARLTRLEDGRYEAAVIRKLQASGPAVLGQFSVVEDEGRVTPVDKKARDQLKVAKADWNGAKPGDMVLAEVKKGSRMGLKPARIREVLGSLTEPKSISLIAIHAHGIPTEFNPDTIKEAESAKPAALGKRSDLRDIPLVTIDPPDARDHDDAIWAEADTDPKNPGGWHILVAIADVAWYVRPGSELDKEAIKRGNSVYFPDRVVPMLPEALSADLCSLKVGKDRACMAVHMWLDANGRKIRHKFVRGLMRSAASLHYAEAQAAFDGDPTKQAAPLVDSVIKPLYGAYRALVKERDRRQPLALDLPEREIHLNDLGKVVDIRERQRLDAHKLVEEFMILANVAAAETLEAHHQPCMYRIHDEPGLEKVEALRTFLKSLDYNLAKGQVLRPSIFNNILNKSQGTGHAQVVSDVVLRSQSQAVYSPDNIGHFGLALPRYAHFTSPIRRYADTLVHRALISALKLGDGGLGTHDRENFTETAEHISSTERRAMLAERESNDRYIAAYMVDHVGASLTGRISGVTRFGLFISLDGSGGDGLIPVTSLYSDYYRHDPDHHRLIGEHTGRIYRLGDSVKVRLAEANPVSGGIRLDLLEQDEGMPDLNRRKRQPRAGRSPARKKQKGKAGKPRK